MTGLLQDLEKQIEQATLNRDRISEALADLSDKRLQAEAKQQELLIAGKDTSKVETDLMLFQTREKGLFNTLEVLNKTLKRLGDEKIAAIQADCVLKSAAMKDEILKEIGSTFEVIAGTYLAVQSLIKKTDAWTKFMGVAPFPFTDYSATEIHGNSQRLLRELHEAMLRLIKSDTFSEIPQIHDGAETVMDREISRIRS